MTSMGLANAGVLNETEEAERRERAEGNEGVARVEREVGHHDNPRSIGMPTDAATRTRT